MIMIGSWQDVRIVAEERNKVSALAEEIRIRNYVMGLEVYREILEQACIVEKNEEERHLLQIEIDLVRTEQEAIEAE